MTNSASILKLVRLVHLYFGVFIAPAVLFFAITGALQTFSLHETTRGSTYIPPAWIVKLAQLHKKQTLALPARKSPPPIDNKPSAAPAPAAKTAAPYPLLPDAIVPKPRNLLPMKIFFLLVSIGLVVSTLTGIFMAFRFNRSKALVVGLLVAGIVTPMILTLF